VAALFNIAVEVPDAATCVNLLTLDPAAIPVPEIAIPSFTVAFIPLVQVILAEPDVVVTLEIVVKATLSFCKNPHDEPAVVISAPLFVVSGLQK